MLCLNFTELYKLFTSLCIVFAEANAFNPCTVNKQIQLFKQKQLNMKFWAVVDYESLKILINT